MYRILAFCAVTTTACLAAACTAETPMEPSQNTEFPSLAQAQLAGGVLTLNVMTGYPACDVAAASAGDDWTVPKHTVVCLEPSAWNGSAAVDRGTFVVQQCTTADSRVGKSFCEARDARWKTISRARCCDSPGAVMVTVPFVPTDGRNGYRIRYIAQGSGVRNETIGPFDLIAASLP